jgi:diadenosine tetraphosphatase ApaH/serine/threonine PP2A family protein phosphatase
LSEYSCFLNGSRDVPSEGFTPPFFDVAIVFDLLRSAKERLSTGKALIEVPSPTVLVGDLHGNICDLIHILRKFLTFSASDYFLFLGDYVDRGLNSIDVIILLLALKCKYPTRVSLLRGNHEFADCNSIYGFYDEVMIAYQSNELWSRFQDVFGHMPLAAVVGSEIFCVHGGLSPSLASLGQISSLGMPIADHVDSEMVTDLVWSDPADHIADFAENPRGSGVIFGPAAVKTFLAAVGLKLLVRAHQCVPDGFLSFADGCGLTIFSSSDYCRLQHNKCGVAYVHPKGRIELLSFPADWRTPPAKATMRVGEDPGMNRVFIRSSTSVGPTAQEPEPLRLPPKVADRFAANRCTIKTPTRTPRKTRRRSKGYTQEGRLSIFMPATLECPRNPYVL